MLAKVVNDKITWYYFLKKKELPLSDIAWAYLQQEDANARMCCSNASFPIGRVIVVKKDGTKEIFQYEGMEKPKDLLDSIKAANPDIAVGYTRENRERFRNLVVTA